jgi:hypothetical protein
MSVYNYNTLTRANDGNTFEFNTNCNVLYVDELPTGVTLSLAIDNQNNPAITLRPKTQLRFKQNDRLFFTPSAATTGTIRIFLFLDESNLLEFDQSQYSSESTISGTVDVDIVAQTGADPLNVNISSQTGQDPLHNDLVQVDGSNPAAVNLKEYLLAGSPEDTQTLSQATGWNSGTGYTVYTAPSDAYIFSANLQGLAITTTWQALYLEVFTSGAVSRGRLLNMALQGTTAVDRLQGSTTFQSSMPYKLNSGDYVQIVAGTNVTGSCNLQIIVP